MTDPIADMFNRIRNALAVGHPAVVIPFSNIKYEIAKLLEKRGFIEKSEKKKRRFRKRTKRIIEIVLKYNNKTPAISMLKRISKPGRRVYLGYKEIKPIRGGLGMAIISTSKGLMDDKSAKSKKLGGEIIGEVW